MSPVSAESAGWIPVLPADWQLVRAKAIFAERRQPSRGNDVHLTPSQTYGVLPQRSYMEITGNRVVLNLAGQDDMKHVEPDDFIIHLRSFQGGLERSTLAGKVSTAYTVLRPRRQGLPDYFRWLLKSGGYIQELRTTTNQLRDGQSIKYRDFCKVSLPLPPLEQQRAIADHLDRETAQIDALIDKQEQLIETLRERRVAVVERALIELAWTTPLRSVVRRIQTGPFGSQLKSDEYVEGGVPVINPSHMVGNRVVPDPGVAVSKEKAVELSRHELHDGDLVAARRGELGRCAVVRGATVGTLCGTGSALVRPDGAKIDAEFLALVFRSRATREALTLASVGSTMDNLNASIIAGLKVPLPPRH